MIGANRPSVHGAECNFLNNVCLLEDNLVIGTGQPGVERDFINNRDPIAGTKPGAEWKTLKKVVKACVCQMILLVKDTLSC